MYSIHLYTLIHKSGVAKRCIRYTLIHRYTFLAPKAPKSVFDTLRYTNTQLDPDLKKKCTVSPPPFGSASKKPHRFSLLFITRVVWVSQIYPLTTVSSYRMFQRITPSKTISGLLAGLNVRSRAQVNTTNNSEEEP